MALLRPGTGSRAKKTGRASEQDRPDLLKRREEWFDGQLDLDPERLVFVDETGASTNMARRHGRCRRGERLVDAFTREALAINVDQGIKGEQVVEAMTRMTLIRGAPRTIRGDNGPEFISKALDRWAYKKGVTLNFSRPGKPTDNASVERFNGRLRDECLNTHRFPSLEDARATIESWRRNYDESRPHTARGWLTPIEYAVAAAKITAE